MADRDGGLVFEDGGLTVGEYVERWLKDSVWGTVRQSTYETYEFMTYPHIVPALGRVKLKLSPRSTCATSIGRSSTGA
jgi:integrase